MVTAYDSELLATARAYEHGVVLDHPDRGRGSACSTCLEATLTMRSITAGTSSKS
jgi:hypothetical protein